LPNVVTLKADIFDNYFYRTAAGCNIWQRRKYRLKKSRVQQSPIRCPSSFFLLP
jgi:hypothetical protein